MSTAEVEAVPTEVYTPAHFPEVDRICAAPHDALIYDPDCVGFNPRRLPTRWNSVVVVGGQGGDEAKGTVAYRISHGWHKGGIEDSVIERFGGSSGAGHSARPEGQIEDVIHRLTPCGFDQSVISVIGRAVLVNPGIVIDEMTKLQQRGLQPKQILVDGAASLLWDAHRERDIAEETLRGKGAVGTTKSGVGPAAADYWGRNDLNVATLYLPDDKLYEVVAKEVDRQNALLAGLGSPVSYKIDDVYKQMQDWGRILRPHIQNTYPVVRGAVLDGYFVGEGHQAFRIGRQTGFKGRLTSSDTGSWPLEARYKLNRDRFAVIGVIKLVPTLVGSHRIHSPLPEALQTILYDRTAERGAPEAGRVSGRKRQYYWLSVPELRAAAETFGIQGWFLAKADAADNLPEVHLGMEYVFPDGEVTTDYDPDDSRLDDPRTRMNTLKLPGWQANTVGTREYPDLPRDERAVVETIAQLTGVPVVGLGIGPAYDEAIYAEGTPLADFYNASLGR